MDLGGTLIAADGCGAWRGGERGMVIYWFEYLMRLDLLLKNLICCRLRDRRNVHCISVNPNVECIIAGYNRFYLHSTIFCLHSTIFCLHLYSPRR